MDILYHDIETPVWQHRDLWMWTPMLK